MLRDYQLKAKNEVLQGWNTHRNIILDLPTGAGKTYTFSHIIKELMESTAVIAHRHELVGQMSLALGALGMPHRIIASDSAVTEIVKAHRKVLGKVMFDPTAPFICCSVDTLIRRSPDEFNDVTRWVIDEAHHVLRENKWGRAVNMFRNARGLGVSATLSRADGKGLGEHSDGVFDHIVSGPSGNELIEMGYLSPYKCAIIPVSDLNFSDVEIGSTGDLKANQLRSATKNSQQLVGSIVDQYKKHASGKLGITFCVDIEHAEETTYKYEKAGVKAKLVTGKTPLLERVTTLELFRRGEIQQLVNVDLFGEGFDVPGVEVVSMGRKTESSGLYSQQFGRSLRPVYAEGWDLSTAESRRAAIAAGPKPHALILDHVGNIERHLFPTTKKNWTLDAREKRSKGEELSNEDKLKACANPECNRPYPAFLTKCSFCGQAPIILERSRDITEVDGDLVLLDAEMITQMCAEADRLIQPANVPHHLPQPAVLSLLKKHAARAEAQQFLRETISSWGGWATHKGMELREAQRLFFLKFGIDVLGAQALSTKDANELRVKVEMDVMGGVLKPCPV